VAQVAALALGVSLAYYGGAALGLALKLPDATPSVMWPPNAILTSFLLLTRPRLWPVVLLAALPPHVALESGAGWPQALVLALYATNCSEALIAAAGLRWLSDAPTRFNSLDRVGRFVLMVVVVAPVVSSFLDASIVASIRGESFWVVWSARVLSNMLTALTLVPAVVSIATVGVARIWRAPWPHTLEAALLAMLLIVAGVMVVRLSPGDRGIALSVVELAALAWFLPPLIWAALRFGPGGVSLALLMLALVLVAAALRTDGPFRGLSPAETTMALQLFLIPTSATLLVTAALVQERRDNETTQTAILASLTSGVVVVGNDGRIITVNQTWRQMAADSPPATSELGADYIGGFRDLAASGARWAATTADGIEAVLAGRRGQFEVEHPASDDRVIAVRAVPLNRSGGGALITHTDVTKERRAEVEAQRARADLARVARVATVNALTASIAHQVNQPLTGIISNAQAAARLLVGDNPDVSEARASLHDIVEDGRRAKDVVLQMRGLLRPDDGAIDEMDLNAVVADVGRLVAGDATLRGVALEFKLEKAPAVVRGDRVQLQQVILNLMVNAVDAVADLPSQNRRVLVQSQQNTREVEVTIDDRGPGFRGAEWQAFEPFYTTKPNGLGLGLSIAKSIVEAHAGCVRISDHGNGGARVWFRLPLAQHAPLLLSQGRHQAPRSWLRF
jgi:signal transduction histidine kinase